MKNEWKRRLQCRRIGPCVKCCMLRLCGSQRLLLHDGLAAVSSHDERHSVLYTKSDEIEVTSIKCKVVIFDQSSLS
jgi:hypothetical protein